MLDYLSPRRRIRLLRVNSWMTVLRSLHNCTMQACASYSSFSTNDESLFMTLELIWQHDSACQYAKGDNASHGRPLKLTIYRPKSETPQSIDITFFTNDCVGEISELAENDRNQFCGGPHTYMKYNVKRTFLLFSGFLSRFQIARLNSTQLNSTGQLGKVLRCERAYNSTQLNSTEFAQFFGILNISRS
jgi:hypothetical protein